jgi:murein DD-endopeptidase MepM/ murein hydrolase activator NlpD
MRIKLPQHYTVLIARTGKTPIEVTLWPAPLIAAIAVLVSLPVVWVVHLVSSNTALAQRNASLTETANEVLAELESLDSEIEDLKERAGLPAKEANVPSAPVNPSQGGIATEVDAETLFSLAQSRMPQLSSLLEGRVRPALEEALSEEASRAAAFPSAIPLRGTLNISSEFGLRRNPFGGRGYELHNGIDFRGPIGLPIYATADGVVTKAEYNGGFGRHIVIDHGYGYETLYAHLSEIAVEGGKRVSRGQLIGRLGNTGRSSGPHLHYTIYRNGQAVNPRYYLKLNETP